MCSLFWGLVLAYGIIKALDNKILTLICGIILIIMNAIIWKYINGFIFSFDVVSLSTGFILIGYSIKEHISYLKQGKKALIGFPLLLLNGIIAILGSKQNGDIDLYFCHSGGIFYLLFNSLLGSIAIILISSSISRNKFLEFCSSNSLAFYAFQNRLVIPIFDKGIRVIDIKLFGNNYDWIEWIIVFICTVIVLSVISIIINRFIPWAVGKKRDL